MGTRIIRGGHLVSYVNFQLLCCTPEAKKILYVKCKWNEYVCRGKKDSQFWVSLREIGYMSRDLWGHLNYFMYVKEQTSFIHGA